MLQVFFMTEKMEFNGLRLKHALEGTSKFVTWKDQTEAVLDDNGLLEYIKIDVAKSQESNAQNLAQWKKDVAKVSRIILEGVRYHIVSNLHGKETLFTMWKALKELLENNMLKMQQENLDLIFSLK